MSETKAVTWRDRWPAWLRGVIVVIGAAGTIAALVLGAADPITWAVVIGTVIGYAIIAVLWPPADLVDRYGLDDEAAP